MNTCKYCVSSRHLRMKFSEYFEIKTVRLLIVFSPFRTTASSSSMGQTHSAPPQDALRFRKMVS